MTPDDDTHIGIGRAKDCIISFFAGRRRPRA